MAGIFDDLKVIFTKEGNINPKTHPYILNRFLSFNNTTFGMARRLNRYIYWLDRDLILTAIDLNVPKQRTPYIKFLKKLDAGTSEFDFILNPMKKYFNWTDKEFKFMYPLLKEKLKDKDFLYKVMSFFGSEKIYYDKYKLEFNKKEIKVSNNNLNEWM